MPDPRPYRWPAGRSLTRSAFRARSESLQPGRVLASDLRFPCAVGVVAGELRWWCRPALTQAAGVALYLPEPVRLEALAVTRTVIVEPGPELLAYLDEHGPLPTSPVVLSPAA